MKLHLGAASISTQLITQFIKTHCRGSAEWRSHRRFEPVSSIIHCRNTLFLAGLKFNNLTGSVNTPLCTASVLPCAWVSVGDGSLAVCGGAVSVVVRGGAGDAVSPG